MSQIDIFDEIIVDNFAGVAESMVRASFPEWCQRKINTMEQFHDAVAV